MIGDILNILKFVTDTNTRETVKAFTDVAARHQKNWRRQIHSVSGKFTVAEWVKINVFTNELFQQIAEVGLSSSKLKRFKTIYSELIDNAYHHGCKKRQKCRVTVKCVYSKWFIQLEVVDSGEGYDFDEAQQKIEQERIEGKRTGKSGIEVVKEIADIFEVHKARVLVVIAGEDRIRVRTKIEDMGQKELVTIFVETDPDWSFLSPDWTPFREAFDEHKQDLVLVRFGVAADKPDSLIPKETKIVLAPEPREFRDNDDMLGPTTTRRVFKKIITEAADINRYFAYVIPSHWVFHDMNELQAENLKLFQTEDDARVWLEKQALNLQ